MLSKRPKGEYWKRRKKVRTTLIEWGIKEGLVRNINHKHSVGILERIIEVTKKRNPKSPAEYFLNGLNHFKIKHKRPSL
jgi:hypothetical protein